MVACYHGFGTIVALLSCCPFLDVNQQDKDGNTALMLAAQAGVRCSPRPSPHSPHVQPPGPQTLLKASPRLGSVGHVPLVSLLLNYFAGLDLERRDQRGLTALMKAAIRDRAECVVALLMAGVPPFPPPAPRHTPLRGVAGGGAGPPLPQPAGAAQSAGVAAVGWYLKPGPEF